MAAAPSSGFDPERSKRQQAWDELMTRLMPVIAGVANRINQDPSAEEAA